MAATDHSLIKTPNSGVQVLDAGTAADRAVRFVPVRADLMPAEIVTARSADRLRRQVVTGLATLAAFLMLGYGFSWWQTHSAENDLSGLQQRSAALNAQTGRFGPLIGAQARTAAIHAQLAQLMTGDLSWRTTLTTLRTQAPTGTTLTNVTGTITAGAAADGAAAAGSGYSPLNESGDQQVGTLTITGVARDKTAVAAYADDLARVKGLAAPTPTSVTSGTGTKPGSSHGVTFVINVIITSDALGGRYAGAAGTAPAGTAPTSTAPTSTAPTGTPTTGAATGGN